MDNIAQTEQVSVLVQFFLGFSYGASYAKAEA
jgi:hypothetical protein